MKILNLTKHDIYITYSWSDVNHGVCGHIYEVIDYFIILKNHFNIGIFLAEFNREQFYEIIKNKYNFNEAIIQNILDCTTFNVGERPSLVKAKNIVFTDGAYNRLNNMTILAQSVILFSCGEKISNKKHNWHILQDERIYGTCLNSINYKKKILFSGLNTIIKSEERSLVYLTKNCRGIFEEDAYELFSRNEKFIIVSNDQEEYNFLNVEKYHPPVDNIFERFNKYIYTPVARQWDCSPRFIAECKFYNKEVEYFKIDYLDIDLGLKFRRWDIDNDFQSLFLEDDDEIVTILKGIQGPL